MVLNYADVQKYEKGSARRSKTVKRGVNTKNVNVIISCVRVPEEVPRSKEQSFMVGVCNNFKRLFLTFFSQCQTIF